MKHYHRAIFFSLSLLLVSVSVSDSVRAQSSSRVEEKVYGVLDRDWVERNRALILRGEFTPLDSSPVALEHLEAFKDDLSWVDGSRWAIIGGTAGLSTLVGVLIPIFVDLRVLDWYWYRGAPALGGIIGFSLGIVVGEAVAHFMYEGLLEDSFNNHVLKAVRSYNGELE